MRTGRRHTRSTCRIEGAVTFECKQGKQGKLAEKLICLRRTWPTPASGRMTLPGGLQPFSRVVSTCWKLGRATTFTVIADYTGHARSISGHHDNTATIMGGYWYGCSIKIAVAIQGRSPTFPQLLRRVLSCLLRPAGTEGRSSFTIVI